MSEIKTNKLSSLTGTNSDITLDPDGTGKTVVASELKYNTLINAEAAGNGAFTGTAGDILDSIATTYGQYAGFGQNLYYSDGWKYATNGYGAVHQLNGSGSWVFYTAPNNTSGHAAAASNVERMRIDSSGDVLINTASTTGHRLQVQDVTDVASFRATSSNSGQETLIQFKKNNSEVGYINVTTSSTVYGTASDYRLKENAVDMTGAITRVKSLQPKRFNFIADDSTTVDGFMAHEAATVVPEAVTGTHNETRAVTNAVLSSGGKLLAEDVAQADWTANKGDDDDDLYPSDSTWSASHTEDVMQGIDQSKLVPLLTAALQEAIAKIETLETKVTALENA